MLTGVPNNIRKQPAPAKPAGGITQDAPARTSLGELVDALVAAGILKAS